MTLRRQAVRILIITFLGLIAGLYICSRIIVLGAFSRQEEIETRVDIQQILRSIDRDASSLSSLAQDWAVWDDTYAYMRGQDANYIKSNLGVDATFINNRLDLVILLDTQDHVVYSRAYDFRRSKPVEVPESLLNLPAGSPLILHSASLTGTTGLISAGGRSLIVAAKPILTSLAQGPLGGTLIFGRYIDFGEVEKLSPVEMTSLSAAQASDPAMPGDFRSALRSLSEGQSSVLSPIDSQWIASYALLRDISGEPAVVVKAVMPRTIYAEGQSAAAYSMVVLLVVGLVFIAVTLILMEKQVFSRLERLGGKVSEVASQADMSARITLSGKDELNNLAGNINDMLAALQEAETQRRESQERYRAVVEQASEGILLFEIDAGRIVDANQSTLTLLGYTREELLDLTIFDIVSHDPSTIRANIARTVAQSHAPIGERLYIRKDGSMVDVEVAATCITVAGRQVLSVIIRDITERKRAQEALQRERNFAIQVMNTMGQGLAVTDAQMRFRFVNPAFASMLGYTESALLEKRSSDIVFPEDREQLVHAVARRLEGKTETYELMLKRADGEPADTLVTSVPQWDGTKAIGSITVFTDLTERKRAESVLRHQNRELKALHETTLAMINRLEPENLLEVVLSSAAALVESSHAFLYVVDPEDPEHLVIRAGIGIFAQNLGYRLRKGEGLAGRVWELGDSLAIDDYVTWSGRRTDLDYLGVRATAGIPLRTSNELVGVIGLAYLEEARTISIDDIALLERFAHLASLALENARLYASAQQELAERKRAEEALHELAIRDELTGLYNRREMSRLLLEEVKRCRRYERSLSLIMLDLDNFKRVNDTYGHPVGDGVLRWLVQLLNDNVRSADRLARYGGEEFAVILPETDPVEALEMAERLRKSVADRPFVFAQSSGILSEIHITISAGIAGIPAHCMDENSLIAAADQSLYEAKRQGRDRVVCSRDSSAAVA